MGVCSRHYQLSVNCLLSKHCTADIAILPEFYSRILSVLELKLNIMYIPSMYFNSKDISECSSAVYVGLVLLFFIALFVIFLWPPCVADADIIFCPVVSFYLQSFFFYSSPNFSRQRLDVYLASTHGAALVQI